MEERKKKMKFTYDEIQLLLKIFTIYLIAMKDYYDEKEQKQIMNLEHKIFQLGIMAIAEEEEKLDA